MDSGVFASDSELIPETFYMSYGRDKSAVFFHEQLSGRASRLPKADRESFRSFGNGFGADQATVYFRKSKLTKSSPDTWMHLGHDYSMDHARVWYQNQEIKGVRRDRFFVLRLSGIGLATDGSRFFHGQFEVDEKEFAKEVDGEIRSYRGQVKAIREINSF